MTRAGRPDMQAPVAGALPQGADSGLAEAVARNAQVFDRLVGLAEARLRAGRHASALEWSRLAASYAVTNATGVLRSTRLERVVDAVAEATLVATAPRAPKAADDRLRILHVLSEAAEIGGLTRLAERWIRRDRESVSSVLTTRQEQTIAALADAVAESGGVVHAFADRDAIRTAQRLREIVQSYDVVICHLGVDDVVAAAAFGQGYTGPPVAVFNHTDHLFSLVGTRTTAIIDFRSVGSALTREARGYNPDSMLSLPLLVPDMADPVARGAEPRAAQFADEAVVAVTVAREMKYRDTAISPTFAELVSRALDENPSLVVCAVGPSFDDAPWGDLRARHGNRVCAVGPVRDPGHYLAAADIYLDPFPFSSLTSLLEASSVALPVVTLDAHQGLRRALGIADFVPDAADRPTTVEAYARRVARLVRGADERACAGVTARAAYESMAPEESWVEQAVAHCRRVQAMARSGCVISSSSPPERDARLVDYATAVQAVESNVPLVYGVRARLAHLDRRDQLEFGVRVFAARVAGKVARTTGLSPGRVDVTPLLTPAVRRRSAHHGSTPRGLGR